MVSAHKRSAEELIAEISASRSERIAPAAASRLIELLSIESNKELVKSLLLSDDRRLSRLAAWVASELPKLAHNFLPEASILIQSSERYLRYYAMDIIILGTKHIDQPLVFLIAQNLADPDDFIASRAVDILTMASDDQIRSAKEFVSVNSGDTSHIDGLSRLLGIDSQTHSSITSMIESENLLTRRYGLVLAKRLRNSFPELIEFAKKSSDPVLSSSK